MRNTLRYVGSVVAIATALAAIGCLGGSGSDEQEASSPAEEPAKRTNSAQAFSGERRAVAAVVERFESAVRRRDRDDLCRRILAVVGDSFGTKRRGGVADCLRDPEFAPRLELREAEAEPAAYDLIVHRVTIAPREDRFKPDAIARVEMPDGAPNPVEIFELQLVDDEWKVYSRFAPVAGEEPDIAKLGCDDGSSGISTSTDVITVNEDKVPVSARTALLRQWKRLYHAASSRRPPDVRSLLHPMDPSSLVRVAVGYGFARATYEVRSDEGSRLALFDLERFEGRYFNWRHLICVGMIRREAAHADESS